MRLEQIIMSPVYEKSLVAELSASPPRATAAIFTMLAALRTDPEVRGKADELLSLLAPNSEEWRAAYVTSVEKNECEDAARLASVTTSDWSAHHELHPLYLYVAARYAQRPCGTARFDSTAKPSAGEPFSGPFDLNELQQLLALSPNAAEVAMQLWPRFADDRAREMQRMEVLLAHLRAYVDINERSTRAVFLFGSHDKKSNHASEEITAFAKSLRHTGDLKGLAKLHAWLDHNFARDPDPNLRALVALTATYSTRKVATAATGARSAASTTAKEDAEAAIYHADDGTPARPVPPAVSGF